jgi:predicted nucleotide-binding protein
VKYFGEKEQLQTFVDEIGLKGVWAEKGNHLHFRAKSGEVINFYNTGTLVVQGKNQDVVKAHLERLCAGEVIVNPGDDEPVKQPQIFIVHGHDTQAREQLELILHKLALRPFVLQNSAANSMTIIEALEKNIYDDSDFGIILMTPDDAGYSNKEGSGSARPRPRQNVVLEMGMVMASLGRANMAILSKGDMERPSDTDGVVRLEFKERVQEIVPGLVQQLQNAGIPVDNKLIADAAR